MHLTSIPFWMVVVMSIGFIARPVAAQAGVVRLQYGAFVAQPYLDDRSAELFERVGRLRAGPGVAVGLGYDVGQIGATAGAEFAGLEIGPPRVRDGIGIGRASAMLRSLLVLAHWRAGRGTRFGQPVFSVGYVRQGIDNVVLRPDQLPSFVRDSIGGGSESRVAGIGGSGLRLSVALEQVFSDVGLPGRLALRLEGGGDLVAFTEMSYDYNRQKLPEPGRGVTPWLGALLQWSPGAAERAPRALRHP